MYVLFGVLTSVASSTGIVLLNKLLFAHDDFCTFPATLTEFGISPHHARCLSAAIRLNVFAEQEISAKVRRVVLCVRRRGDGFLMKT